MQYLLQNLVDQLELRMDLVHCHSSNLQRASGRHQSLAGLFAEHCNGLDFDLGMRSHGRKHHDCHRKLHQLPQSVEFEQTEQIQHGHSQTVLHQAHCHVRVTKNHQIHLLQEKQHARKEPQETCHNLGMVDEVHPLHRMVHQGSFLHHIAGIDSCTQHSKGWSSMGDHRDSCPPAVVVDDPAEAEYFEMHLAVAPEQLGSV